jgi:N-acetylmuramoyl-L-alanine amidase
VVLLLLLASLPQAQGTAPATPLSLISREGRRAVPTTIISGQEMIALDDVASIFQVAVREDTLTGGLTVTYKNRSIVATPDQPMASVNGRVVTLPSAVIRAGRRWFAPVEFLPRALGPIYDQRIDLRRQARLLVVGDLRVPRVAARIDAPGPPTRAIVEISPPAQVVATTEGGRIVVHVDADAIEPSLPTNGGGLIEQIRAEPPNNVVVMFNAAAGPPRSTVSTADPATTRVTIEVAPPGAPAPEPSTAAPKPPAPAAPPPAPSPAARVQTLSVAIDPGHGGDDMGSRGAGGLAEKDLALDIARRLRTLIETRLGIRVVETRDDDRDVPIDQRTAIANNNKAGLFISLHANAAWSPKVSGAEVYHLRGDRAVADARRDAESGAVMLPVLGGGTRTLDIIRWDMAQARHLDASARFAAMLGAALGSKAPMSPRPVQEASLRVLEGADMPAVLVEVAYLTNADQEKLAGSDGFKDGVAQAIFDTVAAFRGEQGESRTP